jgi:hypothetical protein
VDILQSPRKEVGGGRGGGDEVEGPRAKHKVGGGERGREGAGEREGGREEEGRWGERGGGEERRKVLPEEVARKYFKQLIAAVEHAHKKLVSNETKILA